MSDKLDIVFLPIKFTPPPNRARIPRVVQFGFNYILNLRKVRYMVQLDRMIAGGVGEERRTPSISRVIEIVVMSVSHLTCLRV